MKITHIAVMAAFSTDGITETAQVEFDVEFGERERWQDPVVELAEQLLNLVKSPGTVSVTADGEPIDLRHDEADDEPLPPRQLARSGRDH